MQGSRISGVAMALPTCRFILRTIAALRPALVVLLAVAIPFLGTHRVYGAHSPQVDPRPAIGLDLGQSYGCVFFFIYLARCASHMLPSSFSITCLTS